MKDIGQCLLLPTDKLIHGNGHSFLCSRCGKIIVNGSKSRTAFAKNLDGIKDGEYIYHLKCLPFE